ncbi:MAG: hypothetical protein AAGA06_12005 [Pseudomonadota bacterium]
MNTFFEFKCDRFQPTPGELDEDSNEFINPGLFARELSTWLKGELEEKGWVVPHVIVEDWGHWVEVETDNTKPLALCCGCQDDNAHLIFTDPSKPKGRKWFFWSYDLTKEMTRLVADVKELLESDPETEITQFRED